MAVLSRKLGVYSVAAGAAVVGVGTAAQAALVVFDYTSSPLPARVESTYGAMDKEIAVLYMDGTYKYSTYTGGVYTYFDQNGVTTPIVAGDLTADSIWFGHHNYNAPGVKGSASYSGSFFDSGTGNGGVVATSLSGDQSGNPLNEITALVAGDMVGAALSFETDAGAVVRGQGGVSSPGGGWGGNTYGWGHGMGPGFVGFFLDEGDGRHYGWAELTSINMDAVTIARWAYETTPGVAAEVGVPEPMTLSLLALGASGLLARRSKTRRGGRK